MALNLAQKSTFAGLNSGCTTVARHVRLDTVNISADFASLFPIQPAVLERVTARIRKYGFDNSQPLHIWKEKQILIDGHTRRLAALACGLQTVPAFEHSFTNEEDAMEYALGLQTARRNLTDAELVRAMEKLDELKTRGKRSAEKTECGKSAAQLAQKLGTNTTKIERVRAIQKKADNEVKAAVKSGVMSVNAAYETIRRKRKEHDKPVTEIGKSPKISLDKIIQVLSQRKMFPAILVLLSDLHINSEVVQAVISSLSEEKQFILKEIHLPKGGI